MRDSCCRKVMSWNLRVILVQAMPPPVDAIPKVLTTLGRDDGYNKVYQQHVRWKVKKKGQRLPRGAKGEEDGGQNQRQGCDIQLRGPNIQPALHWDRD